MKKPKKIIITILQPLGPWIALACLACCYEFLIRISRSSDAGICGGDAGSGAAVDKESDDTSGKDDNPTRPKHCVHDDCYELARNQSLGFFTKIHEDEWRQRQAYAQSQIIDASSLKQRDDGQGSSTRDKDNEEEDDSSSKPVFWYLRYNNPVFTCPMTQRLGGPGDGAKYVCDLKRVVEMAKLRRAAAADDDEEEDEQHQQRCLVYSIGSRGKFEFETSILEELGHGRNSSSTTSDERTEENKLLDCEIHVFDPVRWARPEDMPASLEYHQWGIVPRNESATKNYKRPFVAQWKSLPETVHDLGHSNRPMIDILKIDCEGCEWHVLDDLLYHLPPIGQILMETHDFVENSSHTQALFANIMAAGYVLFHREPNIDPQVTRNHHMGMEWSFLRMDRSFLGYGTMHSEQNYID